jgi:hypothetical protein
MDVSRVCYSQIQLQFAYVFHFTEQTHPRTRSVLLVKVALMNKLFGASGGKCQLARDIYRVDDLAPCLVQPMYPWYLGTAAVRQEPVPCMHASLLLYIGK